MPLFKVNVGTGRSLREWESYVEAQDAIEALSLVKPDYHTWSEENVKHTGHLTDEAKQTMFDDYLLSWNDILKVEMLSKDNVVYSHAWVEELGMLALEKAGAETLLVEARKQRDEAENSEKSRYLELSACQNRCDGLQREHSQLIKERDNARQQRDEYCGQVESLSVQVSNLLRQSRAKTGKLAKLSAAGKSAKRKR